MNAMQLASVPLQAGGEEFAMDPTIILISSVIGILIAVGLSYWVYKDASKRNNNETLWAIAVGGLFFLTFFLGIVALVIYLVVRGEETETEPIRDESASGEW